MSVVCHADQVTPAWLTQVFTAAGLTGEVTDVAWRSIGAGQVGENVRFTLQSSGDFPNTVVGKFPSTNPLSKATGVELHNYAREVFFYRELKSTVDVQTPLIYTTEFDAQSHDFVVLMEDLAPGLQIDQMAECSSDQAALAIEQLAKLHGPRWADPSLAQYPLLTPAAAPSVDDTPLYSLLQPGFLERYNERLSSPEQAVVAAIGNAQTGYANNQGPETLIHIDFRLDNMIFDGPYPLTILDWQSIALGNAMVDVSYFMGTSLVPQHRAELEKELLTLYVDVLKSYDVELGWDQCWQDYRHYAPAGLNMAVIASMIVGETERGNDMFMTMAKRSIAMCNDLETVKLLTE